MPVFEVDAGGKTFEVEAPDIQTASQHAQQFARQSQPDLASAKMGGSFESEGNGPAPTPSIVEWLRDQYQKGKAAQAKSEPPAIRSFTESAPSLPSALSILAPGSGVGSSLLRTGMVGAAQGGESLLTGEGDPRRQAVKGAALQGLTEAIPYVAGPASRAFLKYTPGFAGPTAIRQGFKDVAGRMGPTVTPATPGENMVKFVPGPGQPPSQILNPAGQPAIPAVPPQTVPHPFLRGWEGADILNPVKTPVTKTAGNPDYMGWLRGANRGAGAVGQESVAQQGIPQMDPVRVLLRVLGIGQQ